METLHGDVVGGDRDTIVLLASPAHEIHNEKQAFSHENLSQFELLPSLIPSSSCRYILSVQFIGGSPSSSNSKICKLLRNIIRGSSCWRPVSTHINRRETRSVSGAT